MHVRACAVQASVQEKTKCSVCAQAVGQHNECMPAMKCMRAACGCFSRLHNFRGPRCPRGGRENSLASFGRQVRGLLNSSQYVAAATERRSPLRLPIRRVARTVTGCGLRPPSYKARMPFPTITAASAVAAQPPGPSQHQPPSHILIAPGTRDLVTPVSRGLAFSDFVANNASFLSWRDRSSHPWCVV